MNKHEDKFKQIGLNIAYYRKLMGFNQTELAEKAEISRTHLSNIEAPNMEVGCSLKTLFNIADILGIEAHKFLEQRL